MDLGAYINANFVALGDLTQVDAVLQSLDEGTAFPGEKGPPQADSTTAGIYAQLKAIALDREGAEWERVEDVGGEARGSPLVTYTREIAVQRAQLARERDQALELARIMDAIGELSISEEAANDETDHANISALLLRLATVRAQILDYNKRFDVKDTLEDSFRAAVQGLRAGFTAAALEECKGWDEEKAPLDTTAFSNLLRLQAFATFTPLVPGTINTLWATDVLVNNFRTKFLFHFEGTGETNRLDKPEFALNYALTYLGKAIPTARHTYAEAFSKANQGHHFTPSLSSWLITSVLAILRRKFAAQMSLFVANGRVLSHLVSELNAFDVALASEYGFVPSPETEWRGLTYDLVLSNDDVWCSWLANEKQFVNARFQEITESPNAFLIEHDVVPNGRTKPTASAVNMKNLLESITDSYANLPIAFQMKFLAEVQLKLLNFYFTTLKNGLSALSFIKTCAVDGVSTLERICRIFCAATFLIEAMHKWDNSMVFVRLWQEINGGTTGHSTTFFASVIKGYQTDILDKVPKLLAKYYDMQLNRTMKAYFAAHPDWSLKSYEDGVSPELLQVVTALQADLSYLQATISTKSLAHWRLILARNLAHYLENNVVLAHRFSAPGAAKFDSDLEYLFTELSLVREKESHGKLAAMLSFYTLGEASKDLSEGELAFLEKNAA